MSEPGRNPDTYLKMIEEEKRKETKGKLKIFFGYAAGVGKTYAMLSAARREKKAGADIVAGYVEPHARPDTLKRAEGLETIPPKEMQVNTIAVKEMDIDAILARKPEIVLIDEMAHTNADGCRHVKRYQDIEEILNAGIDVYTTLNVQHIEGVHDKVAAITGIGVKERIPDAVFERAAQIEMVDIPPEELIERLQSGKVYRSEKVAQALGNFFTIENLTALREIALRRMADWLNREQDEMLMGEKKENASEHIMMCLSTSPSNAKVIRQAAKLAKAFHGRLTAFYVETSDYANMEADDVFRLKENRKLAERFGAKTVTSFGNDIVEQIAEYAKVARVTKIVLGRSYTKRMLFSVKETMSERLSELVPNLEIFLIPDNYEKKYVSKKKKRKPVKQKYIVGDVGTGIVILAAVTLISLLFERWGFEEANIIMMYVLGSMMMALVGKHMLTGILYSIVQIITFDFLFTDPKYTLIFFNAGYVITFLIFFAVSTVIAALVKKVKAIAKLNTEKAYRMSILLETSQILQRAKTAEEIGRDTAKQLGRLLNRSVCCFIGNPEERCRPLLYEIPDRRIVLSGQELAVAVWTYKNNKSAGATTSTLPGARNLFLAIRNGEKVFGVAGISMQKTVLTSFEESVMLALLNESALAFEKEEGIRKEREMAIKLDQEKLRANLLRSISHDLRTPLTSISGNASNLLSGGNHFDEETKRLLLSDIYDDSMWLINLVENLLSVTRIEAGKMNLNMTTELMDEVITEAIRHVERKSKEHIITVEGTEELLLAKMDAKLMVQVVINILDNALKYTPKGSHINIAAEKSGNCIRVSVADDGPGISENDKKHIFEMFYSGANKPADSHRSLGLGLALCKSIITAHGGEIRVFDQLPHGTVFRFTLPAEEVQVHE